MADVPEKYDQTKILKQIFLLFFFAGLFIFPVLNAQDVNFKNQNKGFPADDRPDRKLFSVIKSKKLNVGATTWQANWVWQEVDGPENTWMCFRKTFSLIQVPKNAVAKIAVDSKYWLWVNGQEVVFEGGLKRGPTPHDTYYDLVDLSNYLQEGKNVIAVKVWYFGKQGFSHHDSGKGGFLFECAMDDTLILSDSSWKMFVDTAYYNSTSALYPPNMRLSESHVLFDSYKDTKGKWETVDYDDGHWQNAVEKGLPPVAPWNNLWIRPIPQWKKSELLDYKNVTIEGQAITFPYKTLKRETVEATLPYNAQITPYFEIETTDKKIIIIKSDTYSQSSEKSVAAEYIACPGISKYESPGWINGHKILYSFPVGVTIKALKYRETGYDTELSGSFISNDDFFNTLWQKSQRTLYLSMRDNYMDCPDRERAQWWGDVVIQIGMSFYALDRNADFLSKKSIQNLIQWQREDSVLYAPIPSGNWDKELPVQMLASISEFGFWNYYMFSGDSATIIDAYPHVKQYLNLWTHDVNGLITYRPGGWDWSDWGKNIDKELIQNTWYYLALKAAKKMAVLSNNASDSIIYNSRMERMQNSFNDIFWNGVEYRSPAYTGLTDDRANAMAVLAGFADVQKWENIRNVLMTRRGASPYMEKYVLEALFLMGYERDALERMKHPDRYLSMVEDTSTTLFELFGNGGSNNHAWSGGPLILLSRYCAGVAPLTPAFDTYKVFPQPGDLTFISTIVPSIKGNIGVQIEKDTANFNMRLISPDNTKALVGIPVNSNSSLNADSILVNGTLIWKRNQYIKNGVPVRYMGVADKFIIFEVQPGRYEFEANYNNRISLDVNQEKIENALSYSFFQDQTNEYLHIRFDNTCNLDTLISLYDYQGKLVSTYKTLDTTFTVDIRNLLSGMYILEMVNGQNQYVESFIK